MLICLTDFFQKKQRNGFEDCVELAIRGLEVYVHGSEERLIQAAARGDKIDGLEAGSSYSIRPYSIIVL